jgi:flagellar protein FlaG
MDDGDDGLAGPPAKGPAGFYMEVSMDMGIASIGTRSGLPVGRNSGTSKNQLDTIRSSLPPSKSAAVPEKKPVDRKILDVTRNLEQISLSFNRRLQFVVDHQSHEVTIKVIDKATDKVIKVLPPEELQRLHSRIEETIGFLFDETV